MNEIKSSSCEILEKKLDNYPEISLSIPKSNKELILSLRKIRGLEII
jgi:hypothetical protein